MQQDQKGLMFLTAEISKLDDTEYIAIFAKKEDYPSTSFSDLRGRIISAFPTLDSFDYQMIGMM